MVLEDWGYDYLYLRHEDVTTRVNLKYHTFRDVTRTPVEEFESATSDHKPRTHTDSTSVKDSWIFQTPSQDLLEESERQIDILIKIQDYIRVPFSEDDIDPYEWLHTLSTIDVCALPPQTQFCDERGYEIVPVRVISIVTGRTIDSHWPEALTPLKIGSDDVSIVKSKSKDFNNPEVALNLKLDRKDISIINAFLSEWDFPYPKMDSIGYRPEGEWDSEDDGIVPNERAGDAKAQRLKAKRLTLSFKEKDEENAIVEPFHLEINLLAQNNTVSTHAFFDSGSDFNVISWEMWDAMGKPKT